MRKGSAWAVCLSVLLLATACSSGAMPTVPIVPDTKEPAAIATPQIQLDDLPEDIPAEARISNGGGDPRTAGYWVIWSTCGENNQSAVAAANGGREAGWILLDDLLADPGVTVGDFAVLTCEQGVNLLERQMADGTLSDDPVYRLASEVLTAELNLSTGAESCTAVEGALRIGHVLLSSLAFNGSGEYLSADSRELSATQEVTTLLSVYNTGALCQ